MTDKNEVELAYDDAMEAGNELGYACMSAGDVIRHQADELVAAKESLNSLFGAAKEMLRIAGIANQGSNAYNRAITNLHEAVTKAVESRAC